MKRSERLRMFESNYGRDFGWFVEKHGARVAALVEPQREDQFWHSYRVEPVDGDGLPEAVFAIEFWRAGDLAFRNRATGEIVRDAFAGGTIPTRERPRVAMRGLYSRIMPTLLDRIILRFRRRRR